ncbi:glutathione peroxidase [Polaribacter sargassicola]|uniref:glutathione peroxidase n=1 Tax=Polaribacter sargassicola TaxID=2836891 RepID=UPI001F3F004C|nr:glutathione peroxidase [Polaribacter sp. DS7-9]MCG1037701.1 glutathione peroxidase [Polaribacter sp. DS7-9]
MSLFNTNIKANTLTPKESVYKIAINDIKGNLIDLSQYKGKKILFVNVASECGFTGQYKGLQELYDRYQDQLMIIGVPCNQFGGQEPGDSSEIHSFCQVNYGVTFLITEKVAVKGENQHPLYKWLTRKELNGKSNSNVKWNFQKYLIDENGKLMDYFYSLTKPMSTKITKLL